MKKVALITGASLGIGKESAIALINAGFTVYATARRIELMEDLKTMGAVVMPMDVTDEVQIRTVVNQIIADNNRIDLLLNNAGYGSYGAVEDVEMKEARRQFDVNVFGLASVTKAVIPFMRKQGSGRIINVSSVAGKIVFPMGAWYHATKFAVEGFSDALRMELRPFGIQVIVIEPGPIFTGWQDIAFDSLDRTSGTTAYKFMAEKVSKMMRANYTPGKTAGPEVIARLVIKAATSNCPKTNYSGPFSARFLKRLGLILPTKWYNAMIRKALGI
jgi:short-subunit dehydrogenase